MSDFDQAAEAWDAWEASWPIEQQAHVDRVRVKGYLLACLCRAEEAGAELDEATADLIRARERADAALKTARDWLEQAELVARVVTSGDRAWMAEVAVHLEECFG